MKNIHLRRTTSIASLMLGLALPAGMAYADVTYSGFISAYAGKALEVTDNPNAVPCQCFIADYPFVGFYEDEWTFSPDTNLGLQFRWQMSDDMSATVQIVSHGSTDYEANVDWAYVTYTLSDTWSLQAGRKRLPLFYYSDFFDVGYAMPWVRAPGDGYSWQIVGYDGFNMQYNSSWGNWGATANFWVGRDSDPENKELSIIYYGGPDSPLRVDETWKNMFGGYLDLSRDWLGLRFVYMQNEVDRLIYDETPARVRLADEKQKFYGISANVDFSNFVLRSEYNVFNRPGEENKYYAKLFGVGYRFENVLPMFTVSDFKEEATWEDEEIHHTKTFSIRWDFAPSVAFKMQYDVFTDESTYFYYGSDDVSDFAGDSRAIAIGVDAVF